MTAPGPVPRAAKELSADYRAPSTPTQHALVALWRGHLGVDPVGVDDDFFELGGHSLLAADMLVAIELALGVHVRARTLYLQPTVADLAEAIDGLVTEGRAAVPDTPSEVEVTVDADRCVGSMSCVLLAPAQFALNEHDRAEPRSPRIRPDPAVGEAQRQCPTRAISVRPAGGDGRG